MKTINNIFYKRLEKIYSQNDINIIKTWLNTKKRSVSFRINTLKSTQTDILKVLETQNINYSKVAFLENSYILNNALEKDLWNLDIFKEWKIYIQSISSQIPPYFLDLQENAKVLDTTRAPWSKTSQIRTILNNTWKIIANDNNSIRIDKLKFTIARQWAENVEIIKNDATKLNKIFANETFDAILADLPCSAEGRINLNIEKSFWFWNEDNILKNQKLQIEIIKNIIPLLKKWWILVYSTCTIAPEENEEVVDFILSFFKNIKIEDINLDYKYIRSWITNFWEKKYNHAVSKSIRCLPSEETEWFFIAKFKKID